MSLFKAMNISGSGLRAEAKRIDVITHNIANANTIDPNGVPFRRKVAQFREAYEMGNTNNRYNGVSSMRTAEDMSDFKKVHDPSHPYADQEGYVYMPNVDIVQEMTDLLIANRAYSSNVTSFNSAKAMYMKAMEIGK